MQELKKFTCPQNRAVLHGPTAPQLLARAEKIEKILGSVGVECDKKNMDLVLNNIKGKNLEELIAEGAEKLASVGGGCGGGAAPAAAAAASEDAPAAKKEEKKEESEEEDDD